MRCGHCGRDHATAAEVRACFEAAVAPPVRADPAGAPALAPPAPDGRTFAGPEALGRSLVVADLDAVVAPWRGAEVVRIDAAVLAQPAPVAGAALDRWRRRLRTVYVLTVDGFGPDEPPDERDGRPLHRVGVEPALPLGALHHAVWANSVDGRGRGRWRFAPIELAAAAGARIGGDGDVVLPGGDPAWCDGGPLAHLGPVDGIAVVPALNVEHGRLVPFGTNATGADLAPDQLAAVTHPGGAARIIAPAGSGKTRVLTERARHLLRHWGVAPSALVLVAFNKRAQEEMKARTTDLAGLRVSTLNALALAVVNGTGPFLGVDPARATIDERRVRDHLYALVETPRRANVDPIAAWVDALTEVRLGLRDPADVEAAANGDLEGLPAVFQAYRERLARGRELDFDEQVYRAIELLAAVPAARRAAQRACRCLLVDEFQDLTPAHLLFIRLLAGPGAAVFGVGDDDQTIYGYNGADPAWLIDYERFFPGAGDHPLEVNYRCPPGVVTAADTLLRRNRRRVPKAIRAAKGGDAGWRVVEADDPVAATVTAVREGLDAGLAPSQVAVLVRVNLLAVPVKAALSAAGVPVRSESARELAGRPAVRATLAWCRLVAASVAGQAWRADDVAEAIRRPSRRISPRVAEWAGECRDAMALRRLAGRVNDERAAEALRRFAGDLDALAGVAGREGTAGAVIDELVGRMGLAATVASLDTHRHGANKAAQADDLEVLGQLARLHPDLATYPAYVASVAALPDDPDGVLAATVHRVKGQEWPLVVVHHADAQQFPHRLADDVEEERRVFHVAVTRASGRLVIVATPTPSPFVAELRGEHPDVRPPARPAPPAPAPGPMVASAPPGPERTRRRAPAGGRPGQPVRPPADTAVAARVEAALRSLRNELRDGKPAYVVFADATLRAIAEARPESLAELAAIKGIGPAKLEQYGEAILATVADAVGA